MNVFEPRAIEKSTLDNWLKKVLDCEPPFSFSYGDASSTDLLNKWEKKSDTTISDNVTTHIAAYIAPDGLSVEMEMKTYDGFCTADWVLRIRNDGVEDSLILSDVLSCDTLLPFAPDVNPFGNLASDDITTVFSSKGSLVSMDDFMPCHTRMLPGNPVEFVPDGGRSSSCTMPFFNVIKKNMGVICAVGWSGQWKASFNRIDEGVNIKAGLESTHFKLFPGEEIRTPSMLILFWEGGQTRSHNLLRRLILKYLAPRDANDNLPLLPLSNIAWGGMNTDKQIEMINTISRHKLPYDIYWMDAGWFGTKGEKVNQFDDINVDWYIDIGFEPNPLIHPDGLVPVSTAANEKDMQYLLWFEPERSFQGLPVTVEHEDWYLDHPDDVNKYKYELVRHGGSNINVCYSDWPRSLYYKNMLLNLGIPEALNWLIDNVSEKIKTLNLSVFRQDFNADPLLFWRKYDAPDRYGITEIKYITGLYKFWDELRKRFPNLLIDNCASGGRRLDIESARRTAVLWRSDYQCFADNDPSGAQAQNVGAAIWFPLAATGSFSLAKTDTYYVRSLYSVGLGMGLSVDNINKPGEDYPWKWQYGIMHEYKRARPFFYGDYYPLTDYSLDDSVWMAWQFDRPDLKSGIVQVFRRPKSPYETARFHLGGLIGGCKYEFEDADTGTVTMYTAEELDQNGFAAVIPNCSESRVYFYRMI